MIKQIYLLLLLLHLCCQLEEQKKFLNYVCMGYNIHNANPKLPVDPGFMGISPCEISYDQYLTQEDQNYIFPDNIEFQPLNSCSSSEIKNIYNSVEEFQQKLLEKLYGKTIGNLKSWKINPSAAFSQNQQFQAYYKNQRLKNLKTYEVYQSCSVYQGSMNINEMKISDAFRKSVLKALNSTNITIALNKFVFDMYGMDIVQKVNYGSQLIVQVDFIYNQQIPISDTFRSISITAKQNGFFVFDQEPFTLADQQFIDSPSFKTFSSKYFDYRQISIGQKVSRSLQDWQREARENPMPIEITINPITILITSDNFPTLNINEVLKQFEDAIQYREIYLQLQSLDQLYPATQIAVPIQKTENYAVTLIDSGQKSTMFVGDPKFWEEDSIVSNQYLKIDSMTFSFRTYQTTCNILLKKLSSWNIQLANSIGQIQPQPTYGYYSSDAIMYVKLQPDEYVQSFILYGEQSTICAIKIITTKGNVFKSPTEICSNCPGYQRNQKDFTAKNPLVGFRGGFHLATFWRISAWQYQIYA